jgi:hypothetical protein
MGKRTSLGTLIALGKIARIIFAFIVLCTVDGRRDSGARMVLTLRMPVGADDRELDEGDEEREDGRVRRDRWEVAVADAALLAVSTSSRLTAR